MVKYGERTQTITLITLYLSRGIRVALQQRRGPAASRPLKSVVTPQHVVSALSSWASVRLGLCHIATTAHTLASHCLSPLLNIYLLMHVCNLAIKTRFRPATLQLALFCENRHSVSSLNHSCEDPTTGPGGVFWRQTVALGEGMPCRVSYSISLTFSFSL